MVFVYINQEEGASWAFGLYTSEMTEIILFGV